VSCQRTGYAAKRSYAARPYLLDHWQHVCRKLIGGSRLLAALRVRACASLGLPQTLPACFRGPYSVLGALG
jgi:hypothetical protein